MLVLLVEDDIDLAVTIVDYLKLENIACDHFNNGIAALQALKSASYQCIILDWQLPRLSGIEFAKRLRSKGQDIPILMLTARDRLEDKLTGFDAGVDDYLIKPFALAEMFARIKTLSKRRSGEIKLLKVADIEMNCQLKQVLRKGQTLKLSPTGFQLLELLLRASPEAVSRKDIIQTVWGEESPDSDSLKVLMHRLRKQVDGERKVPLLQTIQGFGFAIRVANEVTS
jgi:DNA-binding response OmpR family regulator